MDIALDERLRKLDKKAAALAARDFLPRDLLDLLHQVARMQLECLGGLTAPVVVEADLPSPDLRAQGRPLLERSCFPCDSVSGRDLFERISGLAGQGDGALAGAVRLVREAVTAGGLSLEQGLAAYIAGDEAFFASWREKWPQAPRTLDFLIRAALTPSLMAVGLSLAPYIVEQSCEFGHCPVCGEKPLVGALVEKEGFRRLTCSFCLTEYPFRRIHCPYCGETDFTRLSFLEAEEEPGFRAETCQTCRHYIKTVDFRNLDKVSLPLFDDLESLPLDILAARRGFTRPTLSAWGF